MGHCSGSGPKPHVFDEANVNRVIKTFTTRQNDLWLFDEQLRWWKTGQLATEQIIRVPRHCHSCASKIETLSLNVVSFPDSSSREHDYSLLRFREEGYLPPGESGYEGAH